MFLVHKRSLPEAFLLGAHKKPDKNHFWELYIISYIFYVYLPIIFTTDTVKPVLSGHLKMDKTKILMFNEG